ncbi:hypothetical protein TrRE_jg9316 [Triparma retinervis]|uniref:Gamma-interferon-inducible lysosomal thiol reductase n=1 Tax=Triparma retinervis TaxID=2557542 RepID=A0A9W7G3I5_9STRA|nr:hypothetical protein TrRE_jg9316 [Triparma retinervis]
MKFSAAILSLVAGSAVASTDPVEVLVCVESLCSACETFVTDYLIPTAAIPGMRSIMSVTYVPFGNAHIDLDAKTVLCQHGETECFANSYEQCAIDIYPDQDDFLPFVGCVAKIPTQFKMSQDSSFEDCADQAGLDFSLISSCHSDPSRAWDLQVSNSELTPEDHTYTPWIVVDGELYDNASHDLQKAVCDAYEAKGGDGGEACKTATI